VEFGVVVDERQVLSLGCGVGAFHGGIVDGRGLLVNGSVRVGEALTSSDCRGLLQLENEEILMRQEGVLRFQMKSVRLHLLQ